QPRVCQHIRRLSRRPWLLTRSLPVRHAVGTCSAGLTLRRRARTGLLRSRFGFGDGGRVGSSAGTIIGRVPSGQRTDGHGYGAFWLQRLSLLRWLNLTTVLFPSCAYPSPSVLTGSPGEAPSCSAFIPASRIEGQSLAGMILSNHRVEQAVPSPFWFCACS